VIFFASSRRSDIEGRQREGKSNVARTGQGQLENSMKFNNNAC
jgi:hypothetical protein